MRFDFIMIVPLLPSHCGFSFVFCCRISFFWGGGVFSSILLSNVIQQKVAISLLLQKEMNASPSTLPS